MRSVAAMVSSGGTELSLPIQFLFPLTIRATERTGGAQSRYKKWALTKWIVLGGSRGTPPGNVEILHALKCVLRAPEALFRACTHLQVAVFD